MDSTCIVQDDAEEQQQEIDSMGEIYTSACTTVVAAAARSADAGLPGVSRI